jgi:hypothetical protein
MAIDSPASVLEIHVRPAASMTPRVPTTAASGNPLAIALPNAARSGFTPDNSW